MKSYSRTKDLGAGADIQARRVNAKKEKIMRERGIDPIALQMGPSQPGPSLPEQRGSRDRDDRKLEEQGRIWKNHDF